MAATPQITIVLTALESFTENLIKKMALDVVANLRKPGSQGGTPVDTGWARANWIAQIGSPVTKAVGSQENVAAAEGATQAGLGSLLAYKLRAGSVFITNNVPYILKLNDEGSSSQAPKGFVQAAITAAVQLNV